MNTPSWQFEKRRMFRRILWALTLLSLLAALWSATNRWKAETRNRAVEITVDHAEIEKISEAELLPIDRVLARFKKAGVTSVAVPEETLGQLEERRMILTTQDPTQSFFSVVENSPASPAFRQRLRTAADAIRIKTGARVDTTENIDSRIPLEISAPYNQIRAIGIGLDPETVSVVQKSGLHVVGRVSNYNGVRPEGITWSLDQLKAQGVATVIFLGDEMLGFKGYLTSEQSDDSSTTSALREAGLNLGVVEFGKQKGEPALMKAVEERVVRVHTVTGAEMAQADINSNLQRFLLGARERNIRLLYVRLFLDEKDPLETNAQYIEKIVAGLDRGNLEPGVAHGYPELHTAVYLRGAIGLGLASGFLLLIDSITFLFAGNNSRTLAGTTVIGALALAGLPIIGLTGAKLAALIAGCLFPTLAVLHSDYLEPAHGKNAVLIALRKLLTMCAITSIGIAMVVGLLSDRLFLIKADAFIGVKATLIVPLLLVSAVYALVLRASRERTFVQAVQASMTRLGDLAMQPVYIWQVLLSVVTLAGIALIVMRSGNDPGIGVSPMELKLRAILDTLLYARPRFKEMFGHGVMVLALIYAAQGRRSWALPLLIVGTIGQASLLNTFCHLHTPLLVGLWRAALGILIGVIAGLIVYFLFELQNRSRSVKDAPTSA